MSIYCSVIARSLTELSNKFSTYFKKRELLCIISNFLTFLLLVPYNSQNKNLAFNNIEFSVSFLISNRIYSYK